MSNWIAKVPKISHKISRLTGILLLTTLTFANCIFLYFIHSVLVTPKSDILGAPLLIVHGARNLQLGILISTELVLSPLYFLLAQIILKKTSSREKIGSERSMIWEFLNIEFLLFLFIFIRFVYFSFAILSSELSLSPLKEILLFVTFIGILLLILFLTTKFAYTRLSIHPSRNSGFKSMLNLWLILISGIYFFLNYSSVSPRIGLSISLVFFGILLMAFIGGDIRFGQEIHVNKLRGIFLVPLTSFFFYSKPSLSLSLHPFESHAYANTRQFLNGALPWKDFSLEHGIWEDLGRNLFGSLLAGRSDLQQGFGIASIVRPVEFTILGLCLYLVTKNYWFPCLALGGTYMINLLTNYDILYLTRFIPTLFLTVLLRELSRNRSKFLLAALGFFSGIQVLISLESIHTIPIVFLVASWLILVGKDSLKDKYLKLIVYIIFLLITIFAPLMILNLMNEFLQHFFSSSGYIFAWGGSYQLGNSFFADLILILIPTSLFLISKYIFYQPWAKVFPNILQYVWLAPIFFALLAYFIKFMLWPDGHLVQPTSIFLLGVLFLIAHNFSKSRNTLNGTTPIFCIAFIICLVCGLATTSPYQEELQPSASMLSYDVPTKTYIARVEEVNDTFARYLPKGRNSKVFDFANEPVTWFGVLGYSTSGGVSKVLNLYSSKSQLNAIRDMIQNPPDAVIWGGEFGYWEWPFNGNWMKQYHISSWILHNYVPVIQDGKYVLMLPKLEKIPNLNALNQIKSVQCNWLNGASRFTLTQSLRSAVDELPDGQFTTILNSEPISLRNRTNSNVLVVSSNKPTNISLVDSQGTNGQINFVTTGNYFRDIIWLDQCPGFHFDGSKKRWIITGLPQGVVVKVFN
ncbi:hypothetical protein MCERE85_01410 [Candidatus Nanopelagicaceae bacterium]